MSTIKLSPETIKLAEQEAHAAGVDPSVMIENALRLIKLRREVQQGNESIKAGRYSEFNMDDIIREAEAEFDGRDKP